MFEFASLKRLWNCPFQLHYLDTPFLAVFIADLGLRSKLRLLNVCYHKKGWFSKISELLEATLWPFRQYTKGSIWKQYLLCEKSYGETQLVRHHKLNSRKTVVAISRSMIRRPFLHLDNGPTLRLVVFWQKTELKWTPVIPSCPIKAKSKHFLDVFVIVCAIFLGVGWLITVHSLGNSTCVY